MNAVYESKSTDDTNRYAIGGCNPATAGAHNSQVNLQRLRQLEKSLSLKARTVHNYLDGRRSSVLKVLNPIPKF